MCGHGRTGLFASEADDPPVKQHPRSFDSEFAPRFKVFRFNWVVFAGASIVLWAFVIGVLASDQTDADAPCTAINPALTGESDVSNTVTMDAEFL